MRTSYACGSVHRFGLLDCVLHAAGGAAAKPRLSHSPLHGPNLTGVGIPVMRDTPEFAPEWRDTFSSARVIWGTWRLFASPDYKDFMGDYSSPAMVPHAQADRRA